MELLALVAVVLVLHLTVAIGYRYLLFRTLDGDGSQPDGRDAVEGRGVTTGDPPGGVGSEASVDPVGPDRVRCSQCGVVNRRRFRYCRSCAGRLGDGG